MEVDLVQAAFSVWSKAMLFLDHSFTFSALKFFLLVYVGVLLVDVVLLLILKGLSGDLQMALYGVERPLTSKSTLIKRWEAILARLNTDNPSQYKVAVLEADALTSSLPIFSKAWTMASAEP